MKELAPLNKKLKLIIDRFKAHIAPNQFKFSDYVTEYDRINNCGSVCCIVGWFPKLFPKAGIIWGSRSLDLVDKKDGDIKKHLCELLQCSLDLVDYLFYGKNFTRDFHYIDSNSNYNQIVSAWEHVINSDLSKFKIGESKFKLQ